MTLLQHFLNLFERSTTLRKVRTAGVPKIMEAEVGERGPGDGGCECRPDLAPVFPIGSFEDAPAPFVWIRLDAHQGRQRLFI